MKIHLKLFSVLSAVLAVALFTAGAGLAFSAPDLQANCRRIESGFASYCDPVTLTQSGQSAYPSIPVSGSAPVMLATSLRAINGLAFSAQPAASQGMLATSLRMINELAFMPAEENLIKLIPATGFKPAMPATSLRMINDPMFP